jgi:putative transposase
VKAGSALRISSQEGDCVIQWRNKYGGLMPSGLKRLKAARRGEPQAENLLADLWLDKGMLQDVIRRKI